MGEFHMPGYTLKDAANPAVEYEDIMEYEKPI
jgi:hypothetical protein